MRELETLDVITVKAGIRNGIEIRDKVPRKSLTTRANLWPQLGLTSGAMGLSVSVHGLVLQR